MFKWIDDLTLKLDRLLSRLPPDDSPTRDNLLCHLRKPDIPCRCVFWMEVTQRGADGQSDYLTKGCIREMLPFMLNGAIRQANRAADQADAARQDIQELVQELGGAAGVIGTLLRAGRVVGIDERGALGRELPPSPAESTSPIKHLQNASDVHLLADCSAIDEGTGR